MNDLHDLERLRNFSIPDNIVKFLKERNGVNLQINYNSISADMGYVHQLSHTVRLLMLTRTCSRCGYDPVWKPDDSESKCIRHTYGSWRYDRVFAWEENSEGLSLEECFEAWEAMQSKREDEPVKSLSIVKGWGG